MRLAPPASRAVRRGILAIAVAAAVVAAPLTAGAAAAASAPRIATGEGAPQNLARTGTASASGVELDRADFAAAKAIDGDPATRFSSNYDDKAWFQVKLASPSPVDHIVINWPNACARSFVVQTSTDGSNWTDRKAFTDQSTCPRVDTIQLGVTEPVSYVRMQGQKRWSTYGYSISEFEIYAAATPKQLGLVPEPVSVQRGDGSFTITPKTQLEASGAAAGPAEQLAAGLRRSTGFALPVVAAATEPQPIRFVVAAGQAPAGHADEGYSLRVTPTEVVVGADTARGALNGVQTLRQLAPQWIDADHVVDAQWTIPAVTISDYPRFAYRGLMIDTARSFYTVDEVKRLIDHASRYKINTVHLHLTDDQGWRIAMNTPADNPSGIDYSLLTSVSGKTAMTKNDAGQQMGTELGHTGFYTQADYKAIVAYAADNGITIVPEIDSPSHSNAALHAIPQLNGGGSLPALQQGQTTVPANGTPNVGYSSLGANNAATYEFVKQVLGQLAAMTPGPYLHVGGDEAHDTPAADYTKMVDAATADVAALGKTVIGWNEYAGTNLPDGAVVQYWNGGAASVAAAVGNHNAKVILSPANRAYYPQKQDSRQPQGGTWACGGPCTLENAYGWDPATALAGVGETNVLGVEGAFWGEFIRGADQAEYYAFPRLLATAEVGWSQQSDRNTAQFLARVAQQGGAMQLQGVNFFPTATVAWPLAATGTVDGPATAAAVTVPPATTANWVVTAPGTPADQLSATIAWDGGAASAVELAGAQAGDIAAMRLGSPYTASTTAELAPGTHTATLTVSRTGGDPVVSTLSITVPQPSQPGGPGDGGSGDPGEGGTGGAGGTTSGAGGGASGAGGATTGAGHDSLAATGSAVDGVLGAAVVLLGLGVAAGLLGRRRAAAVAKPARVWQR